MSLVQQRSACFGAMPAKAAFRPARAAQRGMAVVRNATAAAAPPATGVIADKKAELAINGKPWLDGGC